MHRNRKYSCKRSGGCEILFVLLSCQSLICLFRDSKKSEFSDMAKYKQNRNETTERELLLSAKTSSLAYAYMHAHVSLEK